MPINDHDVKKEATKITFYLIKSPPPPPQFIKNLLYQAAAKLPVYFFGCVHYL